MMRAKFMFGYALHKEGIAMPKPVAKVPGRVQRTVERRGECAVIRLGNGGRKAWCRAKRDGTQKRASA